jgi:hypothetical protein
MIEHGRWDAPQLQHPRETMDAYTGPAVILNQREFEAASYLLTSFQSVFEQYFISILTLKEGKLNAGG